MSVYACMFYVAAVIGGVVILLCVVIFIVGVVCCVKECHHKVKAPAPLNLYVSRDEM